MGKSDHGLTDQRSIPGFVQIDQMNVCCLLTMAWSKDIESNSNQPPLFSNHEIAEAFVSSAELGNPIFNCIGRGRSGWGGQEGLYR